jgi:hypothetical protein
MLACLCIHGLWANLVDQIIQIVLVFVEHKERCDVRNDNQDVRNNELKKIIGTNTAIRHVWTKARLWNKDLIRIVMYVNGVSSQAHQNLESGHTRYNTQYKRNVCYASTHFAFLPFKFIQTLPIITLLLVLTIVLCILWRAGQPSDNLKRDINQFQWPSNMIFSPAALREQNRY